jgi:tetratricopeptide (TPR) repeat protein
VQALAQMFAAAQSALAGGRPGDAVQLLDRLSRQIAPDAAVVHLQALALKAAGRPADARAAFQQARRLAPRDAEIASNFANFLGQNGEAEAALGLYDAALSLQPSFRDARFNQAVLLQKLGRTAEALALVEQLCAANPADAQAESVRGSLLRSCFRHDAAAEAFDLSLRARPRLRTALIGRAQIALERGEADAASRFRQALAVDPDEPSLLFGLAEALEAEGDPAGITLVRDRLAAHPGWIEGHQLLARMRAEAGDEDFTSEMREAAGRQPADQPLRLALSRTLAEAEQWEEAAAALDGLPDPALVPLRAHYLSEAGRAQEALFLLDQAPVDASAPLFITVGRARIRTGDLAGAIEALEQAVALDPRSPGAWSQLELAWRAADHNRSHWLSGQEGLYSTQDIGLSPDELRETAEVLRGLHRTRAHPIGQSLRGGTQTRGRLFLRGEPVVRRLHRALVEAVGRYVAQLPPLDPSHPLLRHRDQELRIAGSWSVRLVAQGFHVQHIHPAGLISSACYLALPETLGDDAGRDGWLELGRPPADLGLALEPLASLCPRPGRLALFPSYLYHGTRPFSCGERLTVAFDVVAA